MEGEEVTEAEVAQQVSLPVDREMGVLPVSQFLEYFVFELLTRQVCNSVSRTVEQPPFAFQDSRRKKIDKN